MIGGRRRWLAAVLASALGRPGAAAGAEPTPSVVRGRALRFPRDHGLHDEARIEWWYLTGRLADAAGQTTGFQVTFFRARTGIADAGAGRLTPTHLLFAHAALTEAGPGRHRHAARLARHSGDGAVGSALATRANTDLRLGPWRLRRDARDGAYHAALAPERDNDIGLDLRLATTQPVLLQGEAGWSHKGGPAASHYYTQPQLAAAGRVRRADGQWTTVQGRAWLDHEWSDALMPDGAVGWDWIGMNLDDGSALTAFRLRAADGRVLGAGGSWRAPGGAVQAFDADAVRFMPQRSWRSPATGAAYPVKWQVLTPAGHWHVSSVLDAQEMDGRGSTGTMYWEGLAELRRADGSLAGHGYLEMTGYAGPLRL
ncbi:MAG: lipocalin-like domain-containing protein [Aquabacterium sp.]